MNEPQGPPDSNAAYRDWLIKAEHTASRDFDTALMTLAGGALGLSVAFMHELVEHPVPFSLPWVMWGWALLVLSLVCILASMLTSQFGLRRAVQQVDQGTIHTDKRTGGYFSDATKYLNIASVAAFVLGLMCLTAFASLNVKEGAVPQDKGRSQVSPLKKEGGYQTPKAPPPAGQPGEKGYVPPPAPPPPPSKEKK